MPEIRRLDRTRQRNIVFWRTMLSVVLEVAHGSWLGPAARDVTARTAGAIEQGTVLQLPLPFGLSADEQRLFAIGTARSVKNVSFTPGSGRVAGVQGAPGDVAVLARALARFSESAVGLARALFPDYASALEAARASFRPAEIAGRQTTWRKDDTRLHVDSFPSAPTGGKRILRVFTNVNPYGHARRWRLGGSFSEVVSRYQTKLRLPWPGQAALLRAFRVTKSLRTPYDSLMLQLHDLMKQDDAYQRAAGHVTIDFVPGTTWVTFTDQVPHAAIAGQYQFEQTLLLPVQAMAEPERAPLRVLERALGRPLA